MLVFLFPGQNSQSVGMGRELYENFEVARRTFEEADEALGFAVSKLCFDGPEEQLKLTEYQQPAICTVSVAALRVLEEREFMRVGGESPIQVDVRVVAATNQIVSQLVEAGRFRRDLYYRLNVLHIHLPPVRERKADMLLLADHFLEKFSREHGKVIKRLSAPAIDMLMAYDWPGNVRELENTIERAVVLGETSQLELRDLPPEVLEAEQEASSKEAWMPVAPARAGDMVPIIPEGSWAEHEKAKINQALERTNGNITRAAQLLGMSFRTLQYRLEKFGIKKT